MSSSTAYIQYVGRGKLCSISTNLLADYYSGCDFVIPSYCTALHRSRGDFQGCILAQLMWVHSLLLSSLPTWWNRLASSERLPEAVRALLHIRGYRHIPLLLQGKVLGFASKLASLSRAQLGHRSPPPHYASILLPDEQNPGYMDTNTIKMLSTGLRSPISRVLTNILTRQTTRGVAAVAHSGQDDYDQPREVPPRRDEFWRNVPRYESVSATNFLSHRWSVSMIWPKTK